MIHIQKTGRNLLKKRRDREGNLGKTKRTGVNEQKCAAEKKPWRGSESVLRRGGPFKVWGIAVSGDSTGAIGAF